MCYTFYETGVLQLYYFQYTNIKFYYPFFFVRPGTSISNSQESGLTPGNRVEKIISWLSFKK
jgi:hypothetical protein